jgi:hypothetical protein
MTEIDEKVPKTKMIMVDTSTLTYLPYRISGSGFSELEISHPKSTNLSSVVVYLNQGRVQSRK